MTLVKRLAKGSPLTSKEMDDNWDHAAPIEPDGVGDGVADDTTALVAALAAAVSSGRPLYLGGKTWRITQRIEAIGSVAIQGPGTIYVDGNVSGGAGVDLLGSWTVYSVTGAPSNIDYDLSDQAVTSQITRVPLGSADLAAITVPCTVKVFSDDQAAGVDTGRYVGEFARAQAKDGSYLYLTGRLQETYTTNRRVAVFDKHRVLISGITVRGNYAAGVAGNWSYALMRLRGHLDPVVTECEFRDGNAIGLQLQGCMGVNGSDITVSRFRNAIVPHGIPGYGIQDGCGQSNGYTNIFAEQCRHAYTTVIHTPIVGNPVTYGRNRGHTVANGRAFGCTGAAWDTHEDAEGCGFTNCVSHQPFVGNTNQGVGFQLRGNRNWIKGGAAYGGGHGLNIGQSYNGELGGHLVEGLIIQGAKLPVLIKRADTSNTGFASVTLRNCEIYKTGESRVIELDYGDLKLENVYIKHDAADSALRAVHMTTASKLVAEKLVYDITDSGQTNASICRYDTADCEFHAYDCGVVGAGWQTVIRTTGDAPYPDITVRFAVYADQAPSIALGYVNLGDTSDVEGLVVTERLRLYGWSPA